jgi:hypothetical protein
MTIYSIYVVLSMISNPEMIWSGQENEHRLYICMRNTIRAFGIHRAFWNQFPMDTKGWLDLQPSLTHKAWNIYYWPLPTKSWPALPQGSKNNTHTSPCPMGLTIGCTSCECCDGYITSHCEVQRMASGCSHWYVCIVLLLMVGWIQLSFKNMR